MESAEMNSVSVNIFGQTYSIKGDAPVDYIMALADYVNDKMMEVSKNNASSNPAQIAILVALNIADEYHQLKGLKISSHESLEQKTNSLISMLDEGLIGDVFSRV